MSDIIRLLGFCRKPDSSGRSHPASCIGHKELVENSGDAGATSVTIILKDAGRTLIRVMEQWLWNERHRRVLHSNAMRHQNP